MAIKKFISSIPDCINIIPRFINKKLYTYYFFFFYLLIKFVTWNLQFKFKILNWRFNFFSNSYQLESRKNGVRKPNNFKNLK